MENESKEIISILNDLIKINNDRIEGYEKARTDLARDLELIHLFKDKIQQSVDFKKQLEEKIISLGGQATDDTTVRGKIFRVWMEVKNSFNPANSKSILDSCEFGEQAALKAYTEAVSWFPLLTTDLISLLKNQQGMIRMSYDQIKLRCELEKLAD